MEKTKRTTRIYFVGDNLHDMEEGAVFTNYGDALLFSIEDDAPIGYADIPVTSIHYLED